MEEPDVEEARQLEVTLQASANASFLAKNTAYMLDIFIVCATFFLAFLLLFTTIPENNKEIFFTSFGSLITVCITIVQFHRGSSAHSAKKDDTINALSKGDSNDHR